MKAPPTILFLASPAPDYLQDIVFHGLVQLLGPANVVDYPANPHYHGAAHADGRFPMLGFDLPSHPDRPLTDLVSAADAIVIGSLRDAVLPVVTEVLSSRALPPTVFLDGEDDPYVREVVRHVDVYCKRETLRHGARLRLRMPVRRLVHARRDTPGSRDPLRRQIGVATAGHRRVTPLPFGFIDVGGVPATDKHYDVAFASTTRNPARLAVADAIERLRSDGYRVFHPEQPLAWKDYLDVLRRSRIAVAARGLGFDTYRYWEIPFSGALLVSERPPIVIPDNFEQGREAVFAPPDRMDDVIRTWLARADTETVAAAGRAKLLTRHLSSNRAQVVLDAIERVDRRRRRRAG